MTIKVSKPAINIREKLNDLDFDKLPFQKMPAGSVLQVVRDEHYSPSTHYSTTSQSFIDSQLSLEIAPLSVSSKIYITVTLGCQPPLGNYGRFQIVRDSTSLTGFAWAGGSNTNWGSYTSSWYDTPSTTSTTTYKVQVLSNNAATFYYHHGGYISSITLMEIAQ